MFFINCNADKNCRKCTLFSDEMHKSFDKETVVAAKHSTTNHRLHAILKCVICGI